MKKTICLTVAAVLFVMATSCDQTYSRDDIFDPEKGDDVFRVLVREILAIACDNCDCDDVSIDYDAVWTEEVSFAHTPDGINFLYSKNMPVPGIREVFIPYVQIFPCLRPNTPVWELAKEKNIEVGATLEELVTLFPKYKMEIYYNDTGALTYASLESMFDGYGEEWYSAYKDYAIFTPLKPNGKEMDILYCISLKGLDSRNRYQKESTVWMVLYFPGESDPVPPPPDIIVGTWRGPVKRGQVAYLEIHADGMAGLYLGDSDSDQLYEIYGGYVAPMLSDYGDQGPFYVDMDFDLEWYIYESEDGSPISGVPDTYRGTFTLHHEQGGLHVSAIEGALLFGKRELKMEWVPKTLDGGQMVNVEGEG